MLPGWQPDETGGTRERKGRDSIGKGHQTKEGREEVDLGTRGKTERERIAIF
jgi:hypothetical protein